MKEGKAERPKKSIYINHFSAPQILYFVSEDEQFLELILLQCETLPMFGGGNSPYLLAD